jgi:hypothetical protein
MILKNLPTRLLTRLGTLDSSSDALLSCHKKRRCTRSPDGCGEGIQIVLSGRINDQCSSRNSTREGLKWIFTNAMCPAK